MHFTREPIIETVITPPEGCKLLVRSSKNSNAEEYQVDAVEVVSFGHSFFFRSLEKPKSFLVPVSDYEVLEQRETRVALKNAPAERSIKIGGGRDAPIRTHREPPPSDDRSPEDSTNESQAPNGEPSQPSSDRMDMGRKRRRRGRRGGRDRGAPMDSQQPRERQEQTHALEPAEDHLPVAAEEGKAPSFMSKLFPPPPTLIKETLGRYKLNEEPKAQDKPAKSLDDPFFDGHRPTDGEDLDHPPQETHFDD